MTTHIWFNDWDGAEGRVTLERFTEAFKDLPLHERLALVSDVLFEANRVRRPTSKSHMDGIWSAATARHFARSWRQAKEEQARAEQKVEEVAKAILAATNPLWDWDTLYEDSKKARLNAARKLLQNFDVTPKAAE